MRVTSEIKETITNMIKAKYSKKIDELGKKRKEAAQKFNDISNEKRIAFFKSAKPILAKAEKDLRALASSLGISSGEPIEVKVADRYGSLHIVVVNDHDMEDVCFKKVLDSARNSEDEFNSWIREKTTEIIATAQLGGKWDEIKKLIDEMK